MRSAELRVLATAAILGSLVRGAAADEIFRCGSSLIRTGMTAGEVEAKCGKPKYHEVQTEPIIARGRRGTRHVVGYASIEYWTYDRGPGQFQVRLRLEDGRVESIERLDERG